jgi:predicted O-methyltransferase YrrM
MTDVPLETANQRLGRARQRPRAPLWRPRPVQKVVGWLEKLIDRYRYRAWYEGKDFTTDWTSGNFTTWRRVLSRWRGEELRILEIGSWEGRSAVFFLNFFPRATLTCIDAFEDYPPVEARFDRNLAPFAGRVEKIKSRSVPALERLIADRRRFDLAYIDGDHGHDATAADSRGVWEMIEPGGVVIWDDYRWGKGWLPPEKRSDAAIDAFLETHAGQYRLLAKSYQAIIERTR